jgi:hypothetical protein
MAGSELCATLVAAFVAPVGRPVGTSPWMRAAAFRLMEARSVFPTNRTILSKGEVMNPKDLDQAAKDVRHAVHEAVVRVLGSFRLGFIKTARIAEKIGNLADQCIRALPEQMKVEPHESVKR